jgi:ketosteroid isomerase-like protein
VIRYRIPAAAFLIGASALLAGCRSDEGASTSADPHQQVLETERAFARTMTDRDHAAFKTFLADEAIFFAGPDALRGKDAVADAWAPFFEEPEAPFTWAPEQVEVLDSGTLALSTGPVYDPAGSVTARFQSIWRREAPGQWRIVFDRGTPECRPCGSEPGSSFQDSAEPAAP